MDIGNYPFNIKVCVARWGVVILLSLDLEISLYQEKK